MQSVGKGWLFGKVTKMWWEQIHLPRQTPAVKSQVLIRHSADIRSGMGAMILSSEKLYYAIPR